MIHWWWLLVVFFGAWWIGWSCHYYLAGNIPVDHSADSDNVTSQYDSTED